MLRKKEKKEEEILVDIYSYVQVSKLKKKNKLLIVLISVFSFILLSFGVVVFGINIFIDTKINYEDNYDYLYEEPSIVSTHDGSETDRSPTSQLVKDSKILNIMLFGEDNNQGEKYGRTDTMLLLSLDTIHEKIKLTSFQRDMYVEIPGYGKDKINASYNYGGASLAIKTIQNNFGIQIDRYAVVDFNGFREIIDILGGVEMELTQDEIDYINYQLYKNGQSNGEYTTIKEKPGLINLNGKEALWYARDRGLTIGEDGNEIGISGDDWDRTSRQRKLLTKITKDFKDADIGQIISIVNSAAPYIRTNLKKDEIKDLVFNSLKYMKYDMEQSSVPQEGLWDYNEEGDEIWEVAGSCIVINDLEKQRIVLRNFIYEY